MVYWVEFPVLYSRSLLIIYFTYCWVAKSWLTLFDPMNWSMSGFLALYILPEFAQTHVHWVGDAIQLSHLLLSPFLLLPSIFPSIRNFSSELVLPIRWPKYWSFSFSINPSNEYSMLDRLVWFPCSPRDSQESSAAPQLKSINSSVLSFLYSPSLTSIHDHWKNYSSDYTNLGWQSNVSTF